LVNRDRVYASLFRDAGPASDGTILADKIVGNTDKIVGCATLGVWLYEYLSFATAVAAPYLQSGSASNLANRVEELARPLARPY
jgi:hypothetical protein